MKLYVSYHPRAVVLARDENHARVLLAVRFSERGIRARKPELKEISLSCPRVIMPPPGEPTESC